MTNGDWIRQMSDEELAKWMVDICEGSCGAADTSLCEMFDCCGDCFMHWLEQEVEKDG